jgi:hypothetical protein
MGYGSLDVFFNGLETLLGPPQMMKDPDNNGVATIKMGMQLEHTSQKDASEPFTSSNGVTTTSEVEWRFAYCPSDEEEYPERKGFATEHPEWCRASKPMSELMELLEVKANCRLRKEGHNELIEEEVLAGRLYTGPMYQKYNAVLRACTEDPYLVDCAKKICKGNSYATTIHAINSAVIKLSKLTQAGKVYRGVCYGKLPQSFWKASDDGVKGGIGACTRVLSRCPSVQSRRPSCADGRARSNRIWQSLASRAPHASGSRRSTTRVAAAGRARAMR